jgi:hypothetical protein
MFPRVKNTRGNVGIPLQLPSFGGIVACLRREKTGGGGNPRVKPANASPFAAARSHPILANLVDLYEENPMAKGYFVVRAEVPDEADRAKFDDWYATDHLPWAIKTFGAQRGWRCWSGTDPAVHYAFYEFADVGKAQALIGSEKIKPLVADFDRVWGNRVSRGREILEVVQEVAS